MEMEIIRILDECISLAYQLMARMEEDNADIASCISGPIMREYQKGNNVAIDKIQYMVHQLKLLQEEQTMALLQS